MFILASDIVGVKLAERQEFLYAPNFFPIAF
jgi:hypothetical protein